jgi:hypothetical protein
MGSYSDRLQESRDIVATTLYDGVRPRPLARRPITLNRSARAERDNRPVRPEGCLSLFYRRQPARPARARERCHHGSARGLVASHNARTRLVRRAYERR